MNNFLKVVRVAILTAAITLPAQALVASVNNHPIAAIHTVAAPGPIPGQSAAASSLPANVPINPEDLAKLLQSTSAKKPLLIHVGFHVLYSQAHIPESEYIGPASQEDTLEQLRKRLGRLPRRTFIVLYCGCCPWNHCPTVAPAYETVHNMGFSNVRVLYIPNNFGRDWISKGFPVEKGQ